MVSLVLTIPSSSFFLFTISSKITLFSVCRNVKSVSTDKRPPQSKNSHDGSHHVDLISCAQPSDALLKKPSSCPSLAYPLPCQKCGHCNQPTASSRCVVCDLAATVPNVRIMLYKNERPLKSDHQNMGDHFVDTREPAAAAAAKSNCLKRSMSCTVAGSNAESSRKNLLSETWLCSTCNHANAQTTIECIMCKSTKTLTNDNNNNQNDDDSNNNKRNTNNNNHQNENNGCSNNGFLIVNRTSSVSVAKQQSSNENRRSFLLAKPTKPQRLSLSDAHEPLSSPDSPRYVV